MTAEISTSEVPATITHRRYRPSIALRNARAISCSVSKPHRHGSSCWPVCRARAAVSSLSPRGRGMGEWGRKHREPLLPRTVGDFSPMGIVANPSGKRTFPLPLWERVARCERERATSRVRGTKSREQNPHPVLAFGSDHPLPQGERGNAFAGLLRNTPRREEVETAAPLKGPALAPTVERSEQVTRSFHRLDALDRLRIFRAVLVPYRLDRVLERLLVGNLDDLDPRRPRLVQRLLLVFVPQHALFALRLASEFLDELAVFGRQRVPGLA